MSLCVFLPQSDDLVASRPHVSREEQELRDVEIEMEAQLNTQHMQVRSTDHHSTASRGKSVRAFLDMAMIKEDLSPERQNPMCCHLL